MRDTKGLWHKAVQAQATDEAWGDCTLGGVELTGVMRQRVTHHPVDPPEDATATMLLYDPDGAGFLLDSMSENRPITFTGPCRTGSQVRQVTAPVWITEFAPPPHLNGPVAISAVADSEPEEDG